VPAGKAFYFYPMFAVIINKNSKGIYFILPGCSQDDFSTGYIAITFQVAGVRQPFTGVSAGGFAVSPPFGNPND
jgi:hypothetical protein